ncbi:hypothetical protein IKQ26_07420 [bacterium]|nr:hypothetical protein [bacterium]
MEEVHFDLTRVKSDLFNKCDGRTTFTQTEDPIYVAFEHVDNFSIPFLAKSFVKELVNDSVKFISKVF